MPLCPRFSAAACTLSIRKEDGVAMEQAIEAIRTEILGAIAEDDLLLPSMPEVALRVKEAAEDENATAPSLSRVISQDAALTARIMRVANSPLVRGVQTVEDLQLAISRMGIPYTATLAIGIAMEQLFQATSDAVDRRMRASWSHSTDVASLSHVLCDHFTSLRADQAALAGLVHEIGKLPILCWADEHEWDAMTIDTVIEQLHPEIGERILLEWDFPNELATVPSHYTHFDRDNSEADHTDVVMVANLHSYAGTDHPYATDLDWGTVPAFDHLGIAVDVVFAEEEDLAESVGAARAALH